jgi:probable rRNA maturation factor
MNIQVSNSSGINIPYRKYLINLAEMVLKAEKKAGPVNIIFCDNIYIRNLNLRFLNTDRPTDVLAFYYGEDDIFGEIYISAETAEKQAPEWGNSFYRELKRLVVHGCLHLSGYDHKKLSERRNMQALEEFYLA